MRTLRVISVKGLASTPGWSMAKADHEMPACVNRGVHANHLWLTTRAATDNLVRLTKLGVTHTSGAFTLCTPAGNAARPAAHPRRKPQSSTSRYLVT